MAAQASHKIAFAALLALAATCAGAQEIDIDTEASLVTGGAVGGAREDKPADLDIRVRLRGSTILNSGLELGLGAEARFDSDSPASWWGGGRYSSLLIGGDGAIIGPEGDASLQSAFAYARGGFGQLVVGRDRGVNRRFAVTSPTIFSAIGVNDWRADLTGLNDVHTVNDVSGYSTKITFLPPGNFLGGVLGGLQLGVSYSPAGVDCSNDICRNGDGLVFLTPGVIEPPAYDDILETAVYYENDVTLGGERLIFGLAASYATADETTDDPASVVDEYESYALGLNLAYGGLTLGGSIKNSTAGLRDSEDGYLAFDAGVTYETGQWGFMLGYGEADSDQLRPDPFDPLARRQTSLAQAGVTYLFGPGVTIGAAAQFVDARKPQDLGGNEESTALVFESSIKF
ncbi:MAG: porin [Pseudomonadota bacterium]